MLRRIVLDVLQADFHARMAVSQYSMVKSYLISYMGESFSGHSQVPEISRQRRQEQSLA